MMAWIKVAARGREETVTYEVHFKGIAEHIFKIIMKDMGEIQTKRVPRKCLLFLANYVSKWQCPHR